MDDKDIQELLPIPEQSELERQIEEDLKESKFIITNYNNGGIFKTLIKVFLLVVYQLYDLLKKVVPNIFLHSAEDSWLGAKAADYKVVRKQATYTEGLVVCSREQTGEPITIYKGYIFKTDKDSKGNELRYITQETVIMESNQLRVSVPVKAETPGEIYNVPTGSIKHALQHIAGIDKIENEGGWITKEGSDIEDIESFRQRAMNIWDELANNPTAGKYESVASKVEGVVNVIADDMHPRGQGTIDIIITGAAGEPTQTLIDKVKIEVDKIKGPYDNIMIYGPTIITQDVDVIIYIDSIYGDETKAYDDAMIRIQNMFKASKGSSANKLYRAGIIKELMTIANTINAKVITPEEDIELGIKEMLVAGTINITIMKV